MKFYYPILLILSLCFSAQAQHQRTSENATTYSNPVFAGDYPDPSILKDGDDYYVVHSSFEYYPGLLIWHSKDLINWNPVVNTLNTYLGSVWAPDLVKYDGKYYIYFPVQDTNYVITAPSIEGPWSEPIDLKVGNIDPGHVVDADGNRYLYFSNGGYVPLSKDGLSVTGALKHTYDGWPIPSDWSIECFCMEGPKLFKKGDYYYLTVAEGGTAGPPTGHMVISARSKTPFGPWENSPYNPIIRSETPTEKWASMGHGTIFEGPKKQWYMMFHGYENDYYNMGRQTLLLPVEWTKDGWFKLPEDVSIENPVRLPKAKPTQSNYTLSDTFTEAALQPQWKFYKDYDTNRFHIDKNGLKVAAKGNAIPNSAPLLTIPSDHSYSAQVEITLEENAIGGLILFYNETAYSGILANTNDILANLRGWQFTTKPGVVNNNHIFLKLENTQNIVNMFYSLDGENWQKIENSLDVRAFHHNVLSGFMSLRIGLTAMGEGNVTFKNFVYKPL